MNNDSWRYQNLWQGLRCVFLQLQSHGRRLEALTPTKKAKKTGNGFNQVSWLPSHMDYKCMTWHIIMYDHLTHWWTPWWRTIVSHNMKLLAQLSAFGLDQIFLPVPDLLVPWCFQIPLEALPTHASHLNEMNWNDLEGTRTSSLVLDITVV